MRQTVESYWRTWLAAAEEPTEARIAAVEAFAVGLSRGEMTAPLIALREANHVARSQAGHPFIAEILSLDLDERNIAHVEECLLDGLMVVDAETGSVIDTNVSSFRIRSTLVRGDHGWRYTTHTAERAAEASACASR